MARPFVPTVPSVSMYDYDPTEAQKGLVGISAFLNRSAQADASEREEQVENLQSDRERAVSDFVGSSRDRARRLESRAKIFDIQNELSEATRVQVAKEADYTLQPLLSDLAAFAGSENWAGIWAKRRQIIENPRFMESSEVKKVISELDAGLKNYGSEFTTDGREVSFQDVARMAGSTDTAEQKEAFRILALRSENANGFIDSLPENYLSAKDPMFRLHLKSFIRDNPRINAEDYTKYKQMETEYINSIKSQFGSDPVLVAKMTASSEVQNALKDMRSSLLYGRSGSQTDWMPKVSASDFAIKDEDLRELKGLMDVKIGDAYDTFTMSVGRGISDFFTGSDEEALEKVNRNPRLAAMQGQGLLPAGMSDEETESWLKNNLGTAITGSILAFKGAKNLTLRAATSEWMKNYGRKLLTGKALDKLPGGMGPLSKVQLNAIERLVARNASGRAVAGAVGTVARGAITRGFSLLGGLVGVGAIAVGVGVNVAMASKKIGEARERASFILSDIISSRNELVGLVSSGARPDMYTYPVLDRLMDRLDEFNVLAAQTGVDYYLDLGNLFGQRQWQAMRARLMAAPGAMSNLRQQGIMDRPGFAAGPMYNTEGISSSGLLPTQGTASVAPSMTPSPAASNISPGSVFAGKTPSS